MYGLPPAVPKSAGACQTHKRDGKAEQESLHERGHRDGKTEGPGVWPRYGQPPAAPLQLKSVFASSLTCTT